MSVPYADPEFDNIPEGEASINGGPPTPSMPPPTGIDSINTSSIANGIAAVGQPPPGPLPVYGPPAPPATPGNPVAAPAAPGAPLATPPAPDAIGDLKAAQTEEQKASEASQKANEDYLKAGQPALADQERIRNEQVKQREDQIKAQQEIEKRYQTAEADAQKQIQQTHDAVKGFKLRDYFENDKGGTDWFRKIATSLASALGAFGAGLTHGPNYALQILDKDMDDYHQDELNRLGRMKDEEVQARTGLQDVRAARSKALADLTVGDAARDRLIAAQLEQAAARKESAQFAPSLVKSAADYRRDAAQKDVAAKKALVDLNLKLQDEGRKKALDEASITEKTSLAKLHDAQTAAGGFSPHHGKGGGGNVTTVGNNAEELARRIREGKDGKPLTDDQIIHAATELHIPLAGKAGTVTLDKVRSVAKFDADAAIKAKRAGVQDERLENTEANTWAKQNGLDAINKKQRELDSLQTELKNAPNNPLAQALAVEKAVSAARGGAASKQALGLALEHLGGSLDKAEGVISKIRSGEIAPGQMKNFLGFINSQLGTAQKEGKDKYDAFNQYVASQPEAKRQGLLNQRGKLFSGMHGFGGGGGGVSQEARAAAQKWLNDHPNDPRAAAVRTKAGL